MKNFILITGNDHLAVKKKAIAAAEFLKKEIKDEYSFEEINGETGNQSPAVVMEKLLTAINTPSFFADNKTIWLKHFDSFEALKDKNSNLKDLFDEVISSLKSGNNLENIKLLIDGLNLDKKTTLYGFFSEYGKIIELNMLSADDKDFKNKAHQIIQKYCDKEKVAISYETIEFLIDTISTDSGRLFSELDKLIAYTGDRKNITIDDCYMVCCRSAEMAVWVLTEALTNKQIKKAFNALNIILDRNQNENITNSESNILSLTIRKFKELLQVKAFMSIMKVSGTITYQKMKNILENVKQIEGLDKFPFASWHPFRLYKLYEQSLNFSDEEIVDIFTVLLNTNIELVSGNDSPRFMLENLIAKICAEKQNC